jgi:hypothetical protein
MQSQKKSTLSCYIKGMYNYFTPNDKKFSLLDFIVEEDSKSRDINFKSVTIGIDRRAFSCITNCYAK